MDVSPRLGNNVRIGLTSSDPRAILAAPSLRCRKVWGEPLLVVATLVPRAPPAVRGGADVASVAAADAAAQTTE